MTANSFSSVSLDPPLVLWSLARQAPSVCDFQGASHFAIHVLAAGQHLLSRRFSTPQQDKFVGLDCGRPGRRAPDRWRAGASVRNVRQYDGGDHLHLHRPGRALRTRFDGEPLAFHAGYYQVTVRHPECV